MECPICFEELTGENQIILPCNHRFRASCIEQYILKSIDNTQYTQPNQEANCLPCPYCRHFFRFVRTNVSDLEAGNIEVYVMSPPDINIYKFFLCCLVGGMLGTVGVVIGTRIFL